MQIGPLSIENPFILAPLAGYSDLPFRILCREYGAGLCYSEMISCHGLSYHQQNTLAMIVTAEEERPVAMQLFGSEPEIMGEAAAILSAQPIDMIDINMGCPVRKVIKKGAGAALMKEPALAASIIENVCRNSKQPVSVKFRTGWNHQNKNAVEFAKMAEGSGAQAITIHARTWSDGFGGTVEWDLIRQVKQAVKIPVIGNGDIHCYQDGLEMMEQTGCDAVMIGRAALGAPWIFSPETTLPVSAGTRITALQRHLELVARYQPVDRMLGMIKNHAGRYFKGMNGGAAIRKNIYDVKSFAELVQLITRLLESS
ncbi:MAG: tRNA dihydrouridine synthase DusB [Proteobacteria bacterium]|nr:tRNA dihydrouridine synthase DusB [Pseudomonadota bacterium]MBU1711018.1 tRNA dihydrouridine synthase DusB [Pseudomonadota bacterium]